MQSVFSTVPLLFLDYEEKDVCFVGWLFIFVNTKIPPMNQPYRYSRENATRIAGTTTIKDAITQLLKAYQLQGRFNETYLEAFWGKMMGTAIASRTKRLYVRDGKLYIEISSAPLRSELVNAKQKLIQLVNKDMGTDVITDVVFI